MRSRANSALQTCVVFFCGVMFGIYLYTYSTTVDHCYMHQTASGYPSNHDVTLPSRVGDGTPGSHDAHFLAVKGETDKKHAKRFLKNKIVTSLPQYVLIFAYMRTGSTLTGDVIQLHNNTIYSFEPLYNIWTSNTSTFANGYKKTHRNKIDKTEESLRQLKAWFTCNLMEVDLETMRYLFMEFGLKTLPVRSCMQQYAKTNFSKVAKKKCLLPMIKRCELSSVRVVKALRLNARDIEPLLKTLPNLKVIHLVRDPRGILVSRRHVDYRNMIRQSVENFAKDICTKLLDDYNTMQYYDLIYPGRIMKLRYEELATYSAETVKRIYKFIGLKLTNKILRDVKHMTSSRNNVEKSFNTARKDSIYTANTWRVKLAMNVTSIIDDICGDMYEKYGYIKAESSHQLKDINGEPLWLEQATS